MKKFMISYMDNMNFAFQTKFMLDRIGITDTKILFGNKIDDIKYKKNQVCMWNWIEKILPIAMECDDDILIMEDDVRFSKSLMDVPIDDYDICWIGFRRGRLENKRQRITGSQCLYIKKHVLKDIYDNFCSYKRKIHVDHALSKFCVANEKKYKVYQPKLSYIYEQEHTSLISKDNWSQYTKKKIN